MPPLAPSCVSRTGTAAFTPLARRERQFDAAIMLPAWMPVAAGPPTTVPSTPTTTPTVPPRSRDGGATAANEQITSVPSVDAPLDALWKATGTLMASPLPDEEHRHALVAFQGARQLPRLRPTMNAPKAAGRHSVTFVTVRFGRRRGKDAARCDDAQLTDVLLTLDWRRTPSAAVSLMRHVDAITRVSRSAPQTRRVCGRVAQTSNPAAPIAVGCASGVNDSNGTYGGQLEQPSSGPTDDNTGTTAASQTASHRSSCKSHSILNRTGGAVEVSRRLGAAQSPSEVAEAAVFTAWAQRSAIVPFLRSADDEEVALHKARGGTALSSRISDAMAVTAPMQ